MKFILGIVALCLATAGAFTVESPEHFVDALIEEMSQTPAATANELKNNLEVAIGFNEDFDPIWENFEDLEDNSKPCEDFECVLERLEAKRIRCIKNAVQSSMPTINKVKGAVQQLIFDGLGITASLAKCKAIKGIFRKKKCYSKLRVQVTAYIEEARKSINTIEKCLKEIKQFLSEVSKCFARKPKFF